MTVFFQIRFSTRYGQRLYVLGDHPLLGGGNTAEALPMEYLNENEWSVRVEIPHSKKFSEFSYKYLLQEPDGRIIDTGLW